MIFYQKKQRIELQIINDELKSIIIMTTIRKNEENRNYNVEEEVT